MLFFVYRKGVLLPAFAGRQAVRRESPFLRKLVINNKLRYICKMAKKDGILNKIGSVYFQGIANELSNTKTISSIFPNISDIGDVRENILVKFLKLHLPNRCAVARGGFIFDTEGNISNQIDILVINDFSLRLAYFDQHSENSKNIQSIEGCLAAITVKSTLNKSELEDSLKNLASIPKMPEDMLDSINPQLNNRAEYLNFPRKVIFAYSGQSITKTLAQVNNFYNKNSMEDRQKVDLIVVNNAYCLQRIYKGGGVTRDGSKIAEGIFHPMYSDNNSENFGALPLLWFLMKIQETSLFTPHILFNYQKYFDSINFH
jgi:hypothetical protein